MANNHNQRANAEKNSQIAKFALPKQMQLPIILIQVLNLLPLITELAVWFIAVASLCVIFHLAIVVKAIGRPSRIGKILLAVVGCILLILTGKELGLLLAMLHLLCFAYLLKPFELNQQRDFYLLVILGLLVCICSFIFQQSLYFALAIFGIILGNFLLLLRYFTLQQTWQMQLSLTVKLLLQSVPLALVLFIVFPKIPPFWQMPTVNNAKTGLSDSVKVGDIAELALSNALAFRVEFVNRVPVYQQMYWRALVLSDFDGRQWTRENVTTKQMQVFDQPSLAQLASGNEVSSYQVIVEPSFQHWLFGLDVAIVRNNGVEHIAQLSDYSLYSARRISQSMSYQVTSYLDRQLTLGTPNLKRFSQVDLSHNPQLSEYGLRLKAQYGNNNAGLIQAVLTRLGQQNYRYTLTPPPLTNNSLDEFFFTTQAGFCEHYASSFTYLMRAAGIPARIVLGYLGAEYNQQGNYYSVYQRDAHAWSEVWLAGRGWVRVDPTASVDPSRVELGFSERLILEQQELRPQFDLASVIGSAWLSQLRMQLDAIDYQWTKLVINYSQENQRNMLTAWLGEQVNVKTGLVILTTLIIIFSTVWLIQLKHRRVKPLPVWLKYYQQAHQHLAKAGVTRLPQATDDDFIAQLSTTQPLMVKPYQAFLSSFYCLQYQKCDTAQQSKLVTTMKQQLTALNSIKTF